jgi:uncharacterized membrane protein
MPDNVTFCPGCGRRMWVPGADASKPAKGPQAASIPAISTPAASTPATSVSVQPKDRLAAALAYITFIPAVALVLVEPFKRNRFVRFHAFQSIFLAVATILAAIALRTLYALLALIPVVGYLLAWLAMAVAVLGWVILWLVLLVKALQGETFRLPWIGSLAEKV